MQNSRVFEYTLQVGPAHIDALQHVNNVVYVQFMQEAADKHWHSVASPELEAELAWVVRRHEIDYLNPAVPGNELRVRT